jgi:peroxiredoxin Q/BCP
MLTCAEQLSCGTVHMRLPGTECPRPNHCRSYGRKALCVASCHPCAAPYTMPAVKRVLVHVQGQKRQKKGTRLMIEDGTKAPDFELPDADGKSVRLSRLKGRLVVVYFYPKDDTSGCTAEAKGFSCLIEAFKKAGADVIGISPDGPASHRKFADKYDLSVHLLADEAKETAQAYGVWVEKSMYGRKYMGVERSTFLVDAAGKIAKSWRKVRVPGHAEEVLAAVEALTP